MADVKISQLPVATTPLTGTEEVPLVQSGATKQTTIADIVSKVGAVTAVTGTAPVVSSGGLTPVISMAAATSSVNGYLTSTDWNTFNSKQPAGSYLVNGGPLGTPSSGTATNLTGTASGLTAGNVTTNANLTGAVTSVGNATSLGSFTSAQLATALTDETGSGASVFATSPTLVTPILGTPTSGNFSTGTFTWPTFNQNTSGTAAGLSTTLAIASGGTGQTTANAAFNALAPSQTSQSGKYLTTDGSNTSWATNPLGTVTSVAATVPSFLSITGSPITTSGTLAFGLSGTALPTTSGGTGLTSFTANGVVYASSTSALATGSALTFDGTTLSTSAGVSTSYALKIDNQYGSANQNYIQFTAGATALGSMWRDTSTNAIYLNANYGSLVFQYGNAGTPAEGMRLTSTGLSTQKDATIQGITVGRGAGAAATNTAVGGSALQSNTSGSGNTASGKEALYTNTTGIYNTATGFDSLVFNTTGSNNSAFGKDALYSNTTASNNTAVGYQAAYTNTTGSYITALGFRAAYSTTYGNVTAVGVSALQSNTTGTSNTAVGGYDNNTNAALFSNTTGSYNTALGVSALQANTIGQRSVAVGYQAGYSQVTGDGNSFVGHSAGYGVTGDANTAMGRNALLASGAGTNNSAFGYSALSQNTSGSNNVAVGQNALTSNTTASNNTAVGYQAGYSNTTGGVTAFGALSAYSNTTAIGITAIGSASLYANTTGSFNTALGIAVLNANTTGSNNVGVGGGDSGSFWRTLERNTTGSYNTAIGISALGLNTTASNNTAVGYQAGYSGTTGAQNILIGNYAGYSNITGSYNVFVGRSAGYSTTGGQNTFVGDSAGYSVTSGTKNTIIGEYNGNQGGLDIRTASNYIVLSDGDGNPRGIFDGSGNFLVGATSVINSGKISISAALYTTSTGISIQNTQTTYGSSTSFAVFLNSGGGVAGNIYQSAGTTVNYNTSSDARLKEDIGVATDTSVIDNTIIHDFTWKADSRVDRGVFAQEAYEVKPSAVGIGKDDLTESGELVQPWSVDYSKYVPDLIVHAQQLKKQIQEQQALIESLTTRLAALEAK